MALGRLRIDTKSWRLMSPRSTSTSDSRFMFSLSFVVPAYNEAALIGRCIASIRRECPGAAIIAIDNNSTDGTDSVARSAGATVAYETRRGITCARQRGLELAETKWVAFIDADTELPTGWLSEFLLSAM